MSENGIRQPPALIPFDAVATINDLAAIVDEQMLSVSYAFREKDVCFLVRYSTMPMESLKKAIGNNGRLVVDLLEPEMTGLEQLRPWDNDCDVKHSCVAFYLGEEPLDTATLESGEQCDQILAGSVPWFISVVKSQSFDGFIDQKKAAWREMHQIWRRLQIRLAGGELHWINVSARSVNSLCSLWNDVRTLADAIGLDQKELPDWCREKSPCIPQLVKDVRRRLRHYANDFDVMWDVDSLKATDVAAIDAGASVLLPHADELRRKLSPGCKFVEVENPYAMDPDLIAECSICGHRICPNGDGFSRGSGSELLQDVYRKCTPGVSQICRVDADPASGTAWLDGKPFPVNPRAAMLLKVLTINATRRTSGRRVNEVFSDFPLNKMSVYKLALPEQIRSLIDTNSEGSKLRPDAWKDEASPSKPA